jgi:hypothetical protein
MPLKTVVSKDLQVKFCSFDLYNLRIFNRRRASAVGIANNYVLDRQRVEDRVPLGARIFSFHIVHTGSGAHPATYPMDIRSSFFGGKGPGREANHSPPDSTEVKNSLICTSVPPYAFM